ncbi:MAG: transglycosylase domain-containing protein [Bifidobacteriaceae bacterium]|jgi:membrane peptidoglycan carboxypeptidase|nr:transglycosylase domain-containing protein [Bifidobacteriaceae bacterium]
MAQSSEKQPMTVRRFLSLLLVYVLLCIAGGTAASGFFAPVVIGVNKAAKNLIPSLQSESIDMDLADLPQQSRMYASDGTTVIAQFYDQNRIVVALKDISEPMQKAVVAREDRRFLEHSGIDPQGIARAFIQTYIKGGDTQGGSTLTQQYVKNVLIDQAEESDDPIAAYHASEETIARKLREMLISVELEKHHSKSEILQGYLNIAQFGTSVYGVETAAQHYFSKSAKNLTLGEAATIAAITKNPASYDPTAHPETAQQQRNIVLDLMQETGFATAKAVKAAKAVPLTKMLKVKSVPVGCQTAGTAAFFCDYVVHKILNSKNFGKTEAARKKLLYQGGLEIYTTMNVDAQAAAWKAVTTEIPVKDQSGVEDVLAAIKPGTGEVLALAQNRYYDATTSADPYSTSMNYAVDQIDGGGQGFQMGSTWKPINFAAWLKAGHSANQALRTYTSYSQGSFPCYHASSVPWNVTNSEGGTVNPETPLHALNYSHNTTQASMAQIIGLCAIADTATEMGYHNSSEAQSDVHSTMTPTMVIGGGAAQVSPLTMSNVYATIAAAGKECTPIAMTKVINADGKSLSVPSAGCHQAIDKNVAETTAYAMNLNVTKGIANAAQLSGGRKTFAKTGTNGLTTLVTGGFVPQVAAMSFVGHADNLAKELSGATINGVTKSTWYGADIALPTWKLFMETYLKNAKIKNDNSYGTPDQKMLTTGTGTSSSSSTSKSTTGSTN